MASTIKVKAEVSGDIAEVKCLMLHPMETGARKDAKSGALVPAHYIQQLTFTNNDKSVMVANLSTAVSRDPFFRFKFAGGKVGDSLKVTWTDNNGGTDEIETVLE